MAVRYSEIKNPSRGEYNAMQTEIQRQNHRREAQRYRRPSVTERAGIPKPESPSYGVGILDALNRVLGSR